MLKRSKTSGKAKVPKKIRNRLNLGLVAGVALIVIGVIIAAISGSPQVLLLFI